MNSSTHRPTGSTSATRRDLDPHTPLPDDALDPFIDQCPDWCKGRGRHRVAWCHEDRTHFSEAETVILELERMGSDPQQPGYWPAAVDVTIQRNHREAEPTLSIHMSEGKPLCLLTVGEARDLASALRRMADAAAC